jgi:hypothetical protein
MPPATSAQAPRRPFQGPVYPRARTWLVRPRDPVRTAVQRVQRERSGLPRDPRLLSRRNSGRASEELHGGKAWAGAGTEAERAREPQPSRRDGVQTPPKVLRLGCVGLAPASAGRTHGLGRSRTDVPMRVKSVDAALFLAKPLQIRAPYLNRSVISERLWASRRVHCPDGGRHPSESAGGRVSKVIPHPARPRASHSLALPASCTIPPPGSSPAALGPTP